MDLYSIKTIKELLLAHKTSLKDYLGQNFLLEKRVAAKMLGAAEISLEDIVLEVGAGIGTLTIELAKKAKAVVAIEKDPIMIQILKETLKDFSNIETIQSDILKLSLIKELLNQTKFQTKEYKVVANLPYYITSPIIRMFLELEQKPELLVLMVQKEVAQRICAKPPDMNLLAASMQFYAEPKIISSVQKSAFWPKPKVDSAILKLIPNKKKPAVEPKKFFSVMKAGFTQPRKQLANNLSNQLKLPKEEVTTWLNQVGITPTQRAETLSIENWISLSKSFPKT